LMIAPITDVKIHGNNSITVGIHDVASFNKMLALEVTRTCLSSFESVTSSLQAPFTSKSIAWSLIELYYASFFGAHSLLRIHGIILSNLDIQQVKHLHSCTTGNLPMPYTGLWEIVFDKSLRALQFTHAGESHSGTWKSLNKLLTVIYAIPFNASALSTEEQLFKDFIKALNSRLTDSGALTGGNWLSTMRNGINYRRDHMTWFPYAKTTLEHASLRLIIEKWNCSDKNYNFSNEQSPINRFLETATCVGWLNLQTIRLLSNARIEKGLFTDRYLKLFYHRLTGCGLE
jgi:hypothetical protein